MTDQLPDIQGGSGYREAQPVTVVGYPSAVNSTETVLAGDETWAGEWELNYLDQVEINCCADVAGTLYVQFSPDDGTTITANIPFSVRASTFTNNVADHPLFRGLVKGARAFWLVYVNGSSPQTRFVLKSTFGTNLFPYSSTTEGEIRVTNAEQEDNVQANYGRAISGVVTEWACLIDLDGAAWHHDPQAIAIHLSILSLTIDKATNSRGSVSVGVITRIDGTDADVTLFFGRSFTNQDSAQISEFRNYAPSQLKTDASGGATTKIITSAKLTAQTALNTGITLDSPAGAASVTPAVGDIVVRYVLASGGDYTAAVQSFYHGQLY